MDNKCGPNGPWKKVKRTEEGKACTKCNELKPWAKFYKKNNTNDGYAYYCKDCCRTQCRGRYQNLDEEGKQAHIAAAKKHHKALTPQQRTAYKRAYITKMKNERPEQYKKYKKSKAEQKKRQKKRWKEEGGEQWEKYKRRRNKAKRKYMKNSPRARMIHNIRKRLSSVIKLKKGRKLESYSKTIGCTVKRLYGHIENQFTQGMSWENYGEWHVDHVKPIAKFDLNSLEDVKKINHYTNLQPLWAKDNVEKGDYYNDETL